MDMKNRPGLPEGSYTPMKIGEKTSFHGVSYVPITQDYIGRRGITLYDAMVVWVIGGDALKRAETIVIACNTYADLSRRHEEAVRALAASNAALEKAAASIRAGIYDGANATHAPDCDWSGGHCGCLWGFKQREVLKAIGDALHKPGARQARAVLAGNPLPADPVREALVKAGNYMLAAICGESEAIKDDAIAQMRAAIAKVTGGAA